MTTIYSQHPHYMSRAQFREMAREAGFTPMGPPPPEELYPYNKVDTGGSESAGGGSNSLNTFASTLWNMDNAKSEPAASAAEAPDETDRLLAQLQEWSQMTPAELIRAKALEQMGVTEEELAMMPVEERQAIEDKIADAVKQSLGIAGIASESGGEEEPAAATA